MLTALLLAAICTPLATYTPTPVIQWDASTPGSAPIAGYSIYYREPGGTFSLLVDLPNEPRDTDENGTLDLAWFRGVDMGAPLQRYCPSCAPLSVYEFAMKAYDAAGQRSTEFSPVVSVCFSPLCAIRSGPCN